MLRMKTTCGRIGLLFQPLRGGPSLIVSHCGIKDTGSLPVVTEAGHQSLFIRIVHVGNLVLVCCEVSVWFFC